MTREKKIAYINMKAQRTVVSFYWRESSHTRKLFVATIEEKEGYPFHFTTSMGDQKVALELVDLMFEEAMKNREEVMFND